MMNWNNVITIKIFNNKIQIIDKKVAIIRGNFFSVVVEYFVRKVYTIIYIRGKL